MTEKTSNWAGNHIYGAVQIHQPETVEQIQEIIYRSKQLKALGSRHSFNDIADSPGEQISMKHFDKILSLDRDRRTVTVEGGVRYGELCKWLDGEGFALHNLASLPHISVAGACSTGTHGSGDRLGNLATAVSAIEFIGANGDLTVLSRGERDFEGALVGLGGLGIITRLTLDISPSFQMQQDVYENLPLEQVENHFDEISSNAYSVSLFTDWKNAKFNQVWLKHQVPDGEALKTESELFGATPAKHRLHPIAALSAENCTEQMGISGPWYERLPHFRLDFTPSSGEELQSEYLLPRRYAVPALHIIDELKDHITPLLLISEVRTIAADNLWMSPCYRQDSVAIHFTWKTDWDGVKQVLPLIEDRLSQFNARPHWGKLFTTSPQQLGSLYDKLPEFRGLLQRYDPQGKFRNAFLDKHIFGA